jgi:hypothetical protein
MRGPHLDENEKMGSGKTVGLKIDQIEGKFH